MQEEIKEILDNTLEYLEGIDETRNTKILTTIETNILLDYITNLQEENEYSNHCNEELRKKITNLEYKIERLEEDNKQLKKLCDKYEEEHSTKFNEWVFDKRENERLNNIIDELEKTLKEEVKGLYNKENPMLLDETYIKYATERKMAYMYILDKLNELKGDNK